MGRYKTEFWVGLVAVVGVLTALYMVHRTGDLRFERHSGYPVAVNVSDVAGLDTGDSVRVAGVYVGKVEEIRLVGSVGRVILSISNDVALYEDASARVSTYGLLGDRFIAIEPGSPGLRRLGPGDEIRTAQVPESMDVFLDRLSQVAGDIKRVTESLSNVLGGPEGENALREILTNTQELSRELATMAKENQGQIREITSNLASLTQEMEGVVSENREAIRKTMAAMPETAENLRGFTEEAHLFLKENRQGLSETLEQLRLASAKLNASLENIESVSKTIREGEGSLGKLVQDEALYDEAKNTLVEMRNLIEDLREQAPISALISVGGAAF